MAENTKPKAPGVDQAALQAALKALLPTLKEQLKDELRDEVEADFYAAAPAEPGQRKLYGTPAELAAWNDCPLDKCKVVELAQFDGRVITTKAKLHSHPLHGHLYAGEVVAVPNDLWTDGHKRMVKSGRLALSDDKPNRPLFYKDDAEVMANDPKYRELSKEEREEARQEVIKAIENLKAARKAARQKHRAG